MDEVKHLLAGLAKVSLKLTIAALLLFYGGTYLMCAVSNGCWNPVGCVAPTDIAAWREFQKAPNAYGGPHS